MASIVAMPMAGGIENGNDNPSESQSDFQTSLTVDMGAPFIPEPRPSITSEAIIIVAYLLC